MVDFYVINPWTNLMSESNIAYHEALSRTNFAPLGTVNIAPQGINHCRARRVTGGWS
jgi:hypothetical protein